MVFGKIFSRFFLLSFFSLIFSMGAFALACGDTITTDTNLSEDMLNCPADGIVVGANNVTLDCQEHKITGNGDGSGIVIVDVKRASVENCFVENFLNGFYLETTKENNLTNNVVRYNDSGIFLFTRSNYNLISDNLAENNVNGFELSGTLNHNLVTRNTAINNNVGFFSNGRSNEDNNYTYNRSFSNQYGFIVGAWAYFSGPNEISSNVIANNSKAGIKVKNAIRNLIYNNLVRNQINATQENATTFWNIQKTPGINIVGGPFLGGNYWSDYRGLDLNDDGLGDTEVPYDSNGQIPHDGDMLPLVSRIPLIVPPRAP